ncbi:MAG: Rieske 2Fe-2S domain-containing protein [Chloroflexi bacterium]|nr:Rieske 2Fe-2S domain-containing protein [Chloroflexota bacterium]
MTAASTTTRCYNLGPLRQVPPGEGRVFRVGRSSVAVFRARDGKAYATQALCPHRAGPLADGIIGAGKVVCPLHGEKFDLVTGQSLGNRCPPLEIYPALVDDGGDIIVSLPNHQR